MAILPKRTRERLIQPYVELNRKLDVVIDALGRLQDDVDRSRALLRHLYDEEPANRRRLHALRESDDYTLAFTEPEPLVSFLVPTYDSYSTLGEVTLPSILNQTYSNLEVIVVGDAAPPETAAVIEKLGDSRIQYFNRSVRGDYPDDATRWYVVGSPPYNDALSMARGRWIAGMGDDDAARPEHTETLLRAAQEQRLEQCYGRQRVRFSSGGEKELGEFPPALGKWGLQAAIYHSGLRFFGLELTDALYDEPNDWSLCRRMLRAGVRFGFVDQVVVDKHESRRTAEQWEAGSIPDVE
jgi:hypothetical protein